MIPRNAPTALLFAPMTTTSTVIVLDALGLGGPGEFPVPLSPARPPHIVIDNEIVAYGASGFADNRGGLLTAALTATDTLLSVESVNGIGGTIWLANTVEQLANDAEAVTVVEIVDARTIVVQRGPNARAYNPPTAFYQTYEPNSAMPALAPRVELRGLTRGYGNTPVTTHAVGDVAAVDLQTEDYVTLADAGLRVVQLLEIPNPDPVNPPVASTSPRSLLAQQRDIAIAAVTANTVLGGDHVLSTGSGFTFQVGPASTFGTIFVAAERVADATGVPIPYASRFTSWYAAGNTLIADAGFPSPSFNDVDPDNADLQFNAPNLFTALRGGVYRFFVLVEWTG